jgi:hypothetical protein
MYSQINNVEEFELSSTPYLDLLRSWSAAFDAYVEENETHATVKEREGVKLLKIKRCLAILSFQPKRTEIDDQIAWDPFTPMYSEIITLASTFVRGPPLSPLSSNKTFTMDSGVIGPLYDVAASCRDPILRRQAIFLLKTLSRQEGAWDSDLAARVAERVIAIEEEGLSGVRSCADVADWARIRVEPRFDPEGRRAVLKYRRLESPCGTVRKMIEEVIEW